MYRVTLVRTHSGMLYKWSRQKCTGLHWYAHTEGCCTNGAGRSVQGFIRTHTQRGAVQMEPAEVYRVSAWTREAKNGEGADKAHGEESCVTSRLFLVFQTGQS